MSFGCLSVPQKASARRPSRHLSRILRAEVRAVGEAVDDLGRRCDDAVAEALDTADCGPIRTTWRPHHSVAAGSVKVPPAPSATPSDPARGQAEAPSDQPADVESPASFDLPGPLRQVRSDDAEAVEPASHDLSTNLEPLTDLSDLAAATQQLLIRAIVGDSDLHSEAFAARVRAMRAELAAGREPTALEGLAIDRVVTCWLHVAKAEFEFATCPDESPRRRFFSRELERSQRRYGQAIRMLLEVRGRIAAR